MGISVGTLIAILNLYVIFLLKMLHDTFYFRIHLLGWFFSAKVLRVRFFSLFSIMLYQKKSNQIHAVSRTQQGRQREPSVKTLRSPLSAEFWRHCVLSGRTQRHASPQHQSEENRNINLSNTYFISSSGDPTHNQSV